MMLSNSRKDPEVPIAAGRRQPVQRRSRERVERILRVAEELVVRDGVDALSTRVLAERAGLPVGSLYTYFADRESIIRALIERHVGAMDVRVTAKVAALSTVSVRTLVEAVVGSYLETYREQPSFVALWFQGRVSPEIVTFVRQRNALLAEAFHAYAVSAGILRPDTDRLVLEFAAEIIDSVLGLVHRDDLGGDARLANEGTEMIVSYLERHATVAGVTGLRPGAVPGPLRLGGR